MSIKKKMPTGLAKAKMSAKKKVAAVIAAALVIFIISPIFPYAVSLGVMSVYSGIHEKDSIMAQKAIELEIPGGNATAEKDWYPFVMTFNPGSSFGRIAGDSSLELSILYNFGAFDLRRGCSILYDRTSEYYSSFYGAYLVTRKDDEAAVSSACSTAPFGFDSEGHIDTEQIAIVPEFDFQHLVLGDFGIGTSEEVFQWDAETAAEDVSYLGYDGWSRVDANLLINGAAHIKRGFRRSYLQYGVPAYDVTENKDFLPVEMEGRIYGRYFEEWDTSVFLYILTPGKETLEKCDRDILSKSLLR